MNKQNVVIIEDEVPAARLLHSMVSRVRPEWNISVLPGSVDEAVAWFASHPHPDLIFLDIQLADGNSFDFLSAAHPSSIIIFTTAYLRPVCCPCVYRKQHRLYTETCRRATTAGCHCKIRNITK